MVDVSSWFVEESSCAEDVMAGSVDDELLLALEFSALVPVLLSKVAAPAVVVEPLVASVELVGCFGEVTPVDDLVVSDSDVLPLVDCMAVDASGVEDDELSVGSGVLGGGVEPATSDVVDMLASVVAVKASVLWSDTVAGDADVVDWPIIVEEELNISVVDVVVDTVLLKWGIKSSLSAHTKSMHLTKNLGLKSATTWTIDEVFQLSSSLQS